MRSSTKNSFKRNIKKLSIFEEIIAAHKDFYDTSGQSLISTHV